MTRDIVSLINKKLKELEQNLIFLKNVSFEINRDNLKEDIIRYWGIERGIHICIESVIDIANILIASSEIEKPSTYRETILVLSELAMLPKSFSKDLATMAQVRNILVYNYTGIDKEVILDVLHNKLDDFMKFTRYINKWLKETTNR